MNHRPIQYLADHEQSGRALFTRRNDAHAWVEEQTDFHHGDQNARWVDGGEHDWEALRLDDGTTAGTVYALQLDGTLPDDDDAGDLD